MHVELSAPLASDEIRVWSVPLESPVIDVGRCQAALSLEERARAARFRFERDGRHFAVARGTLRVLLGGVLGCASEAVAIEGPEFRKPRLRAGAIHDVRFNVSHSHGHALVALALGLEVGVDLEQMRPEVDCAGIVASQFAPAERRAWADVPEARRREVFFHGWARKEAYVKARGEGFAREPASYAVELLPESAGALLSDVNDPDAPRQWRVQRLSAPPGFAAALAYAVDARTVRVREYRLAE